MSLFYRNKSEMARGIKMNRTTNAASVCRSVFHSGEATTKEDYTQVWVRLINQLEKNKRVPAGAH